MSSFDTDDCKPAQTTGEATNISSNTVSTPAPAPPDSISPKGQEGIDKDKDEGDTYHFQHAYSEEQQKTIRDIAAIFQKNFEGVVFSDKDTLKSTLRNVGKNYGVFVSSSAERIFSCSRYRDPMKSTAKIRNSKSNLSCNCPMKCRYGFVVSVYPDPETGGRTNRRDNKYRNTPELKEVRVLPSSVWFHDNGCLPSYEQYLYQERKAGKRLVKQCAAFQSDQVSVVEMNGESPVREYGEVGKWLFKGLPQHDAARYLEIMIEKGIDTMEIVKMDMEESDLDFMKPVHKRMTMRKLSELRNE